MGWIKGYPKFYLGQKQKAFTSLSRRYFIDLFGAFNRLNRLRLKEQSDWPNAWKTRNPLLLKSAPGDCSVDYQETLQFTEE